MDFSKATPIALTLAACYAAWKFSGNAEVKLGAVAVAAYVVANNLPIVRDGLQQRLVA